MNKEYIEIISREFIKEFHCKPILIHAPGRINIIGEHTDYNEGFVFPAAIDKGIIAAFSESSDTLCHAIALDKHEQYSFNISDLKPIENGGWRNYLIGVLAEINNSGKRLKPFNLIFGGDIPDGAGLSSSAALENSLVFGLNELLKLNLSKKEMIFISQRAEHHYAGVKCGIMDQYASMFGLENHALLLDCRTLISKPYKIDFEEYKIVLVNSNVSHNLVDASYNNRRDVCEYVSKILQVEALRDVDENMLNAVKHLLSETDYQMALYVIEENNRVLKAANYIATNNIKGLGGILFEGHEGMKNQFKITCKEIDFLVSFAKNYNNVIGSRMMGGGFGGCTINLVHEASVKSFADEITDAYHQKFGFNSSIYHVELSNGTQVIN